MVLGILNSTRLFRWTQHKFHHAHPGSVFVPNLRFGTTGPDEGTYIAVSNTSPNLRRYDWISRVGVLGAVFRRRHQGSGRNSQQLMRQQLIFRLGMENRRQARVVIGPHNMTPFENTKRLQAFSNVKTFNIMNITYQSYLFLNPFVLSQ